MNKLKWSLVLGVLLTISSVAFSQIEKPIKWAFSYKQIDASTIELIADATIDKGWHLYSAYLPENGPVPTTLAVQPSALFSTIGRVIERPVPVKIFDKTFDIELAYFEKQGILVQLIEIKNSDPFILKGSVEFMACNDEQCLPPEVIDFELNIKPTAKSADVQQVNESSQSIVTIETQQTLNGHVDSLSTDSIIGAEVKPNTTIESESTNESSDSYLTIFLVAFLGGLAALLTPCVFPMIPMTVSFFTKQSKTRSEGIRNSLIYGISIIVIYVLLGTVVTAIFGADSLNALSTDPWFNLFFALLLIIFAISFFGAFEIVMPSKWVNAADRKVDKGGLLGIFFMAFTLALVSFSCTGPIVGALIVQAAREGGLAPIIGMLGFSLAIAIPFAFFAAFPGYLNSLPKSGGWLNSVKVVLGFRDGICI